MTKEFVSRRSAKRCGGWWRLPASAEKKSSQNVPNGSILRITPRRKLLKTNDKCIRGYMGRVSQLIAGLKTELRLR